MEALKRERPDIPPERIASMRSLMEAHVGDVAVTGYEPLIASLTLTGTSSLPPFTAAPTSGESLERGQATWRRTLSR